MKQPKRLNSRFPGTCADCGTKVNTGEPILWLRKNTIVCSDCDAAGYDDAGQPIGSANSAPAGDWSAALAWNDTPPAPGASIGINADRVATVTPADRVAAAKPADDKRAADIAAASRPAITSTKFRNNTTGEIVARVPLHDIANYSKYDGPIAAGGFVNPPRPETDSAPELPAARVLKTVNAERPELNNTAATVVDLLVTIVNALDRLDIDDAEKIAAHCLHFANDTASGSRRRVWQSLARTIH